MSDVFGPIGTLFNLAYYSAPIAAGLGTYSYLFPRLHAGFVSGLAPKRMLTPVPEYAKEMLAKKLGLTTKFPERIAIRRGGKTIFKTVTRKGIPSGLAERAWLLQTPTYLERRALASRLARIGALGGGLLGAYAAAKILGII